MRITDWIMWSPIRWTFWRGVSAGQLGPRVFLRRGESTLAAGEPRVAPLLLKIRSDLKTAMKAKDKVRLVIYSHGKKSLRNLIILQT